MNRKDRNNCSICHAEGVNSRTCTGEILSHQALANPKIERPPVFFRDPMTQDVFVADFDPNTGAYGIENAVPIGPDGEDIVPLVHDPEKFQQWVIDWEAVDEGAGIKPVDTPTEQDEPSLVHEWQLTRLERLEAKLDRIIAHLGL